MQVNENQNPTIRPIFFSRIQFSAEDEMISAKKASFFVRANPNSYDESWDDDVGFAFSKPLEKSEI